jgi:hypothetical protein
MLLGCREHVTKQRLALGRAAYMILMTILVIMMI